MVFWFTRIASCRQTAGHSLGQLHRRRYDIDNLHDDPADNDAGVGDAEHVAAFQPGSETYSVIQPARIARYTTNLLLLRTPRGATAETTDMIDAGKPWRGDDTMRVRRRWLVTACVACAALAIGGCSSFDVVNRITASGHYSSDRDIAYGADPRQRLDVHVPKRRNANAPLIVFFYGGGWRSGSKADYEFVASRLAEAGFVVVLPDYRLHPQVAFPAFVEDGSLALQWAHQNASRYGADPRKLYVAGHSAGAHIAALIALDPDYLAQLGMAQGDIAGLIGLSGPYDFLPLGDGYLQQVFPESARAASQPVNFVDKQAPPTLLIHGTDDDTVWPRNSERLADRLRESGVDVQLRLYDGVGHARVVAAMASPLDGLAKTADDIIAFVSQRQLATD